MINDDLSNSVSSLNSNYKLIGGMQTTGYKTGIAVPSSSETELNSITLQPGIYLLRGYIGFAANSNGYRSVRIAEKGSSGTGQFRISPASGIATNITTSIFISVDVATDYSLYALQNSGSELSCSYLLESVRLK